MLGASQQNQMLGINMQTQRVQANAQAGMDVGGSLMSLGMGGMPLGAAGGAGGGGAGMMPQTQSLYQGGIGQGAYGNGTFGQGIANYKG